MALLLKNGAVFLHIPKTGGNWVSRILDELELIDQKVGHKHADTAHFLGAQGGRTAAVKYAVNEIFFPHDKKRTNPYMFCFVRNPLTWYESWFKYMSQPKRNWQFFGDETDIHDWHPNAMLNGLGSDDFNQFARNVLNKRPGYVSEMYGWYTGPQTDFVGRQENLKEDLITVLHAMNVVFDEEWVRNYGKVGVSPKTEHKIVWNPELKREVALCEYAGMVRYGYQATLAELGIDVGQLIAQPG